VGLRAQRVQDAVLQAASFMTKGSANREQGGARKSEAMPLPRVLEGSW
jgi:hypothetical protein